jgi:hypothetical protein
MFKASLGYREGPYLKTTTTTTGKKKKKERKKERTNSINSMKFLRNSGQEALCLGICNTE